MEPQRAAAPEPFYDAHTHFWDHAEAGLRWRFLEPDFEHPRLKNTQSLDAPRYGPAELCTEAGDLAPTKVVHVQCAQADDLSLETRFLWRMADETGWPHAIVAGVRLGQADVVPLIDRHVECPLVRGLRDLSLPSSFQPDDVATAFDRASTLGLSVEVMLPPEQLATITRLAQRWPDVTIVVGHAGLPTERSVEYLRRWAAELRAVAERTDRVVLKLSAIASSSDPHWTVDSIRPLVLTAIEAFGAERCMFASNWPIDRLYGTYRRLVGAYRDIVAELTPAERLAVLSGTAGRVYGI